MIEERPNDHSARKGQKPAPVPKTEGLDSLDRERAASVADEGGSAAARVEKMEPSNAKKGAIGKGGLSKRHWSFVPFVLALWAAPVTSHAQIYLTPSAGLAFSGSTDDSKMFYGGDLAFLSHGHLGFAVDFGYVRNFFGDSAPGSGNNVTTLMGNLVLASSGRTRFYASGGVGLLKTSVEDVPGFLDVHSNDWGLNAGAGIYIIGDGPIGARADIRYFRRLTDPEPDGEFDIDVGSLRYWRAGAGVVFRF